MEQIMFQSPHQLQEAYQKEKGIETWKNNKHRKTFTYNDNVLQNRGNISFIQSYRHPLLIESMQNS
jgi:hypothetical protein